MCASKDVRAKVASVINRIRPAIQKDGSDIELLDVAAGIVRFKLTGRCLSCSNARETLQKGIERAIQAESPDIKGVKVVS